MFDWEGRILDNKSIMVVKAALPYLDIPVGEIVDMEGLLRAIRNFCFPGEQKLIDMLLNFFMMKRMMSIINMMNEAQNSEQGMEGMFELLKNQMPKEQQDMFEMMSMMMSSMAEMDGMDAGGSGESEDGGPVVSAEEKEAAAEECADARNEEGEVKEESIDKESDGQSLPEIWRSIVENIGEEPEEGQS